MPSPAPSLRTIIQDSDRRARVAADAVDEAEAAVNERSGLRGLAAKIGFETIQMVRPGFLERHIHALLPSLADAIEPQWQQGVASGDPVAHFEADADEVAAAMLAVTDAHVEGANDDKATAVYNRLRPHAPQRLAEQAPRLARFVQKHANEAQ